MGVIDDRKQSLYFPEGMLAELAAEAKRQGRSRSQLIREAWRLAKESIMSAPAATGDVKRGE